MAEYQLLLYDPYGNALTPLDGLVSMDAARAVNAVGAASFVIPKHYDSYLFSEGDVILDNRIEIRRKIASSFYLEGETQWLTVDAEKVRNTKGERLTNISTVDANDLLRRKIVAYNSGSAQASKSAAASDDLVKAVVRENLGSLATDTARDLSAYLSVEVNKSLGASIAKAFARKNVLDVLNDLSQSSYQAGTYLAFDIISPTSTTLEFRTYIGQRGTDKRFPGSVSPVLLGPEFGNVSGSVRGYYHRNEVNYVYSGGQGVGAARAIGVSSDPVRIALSPFNRRELFIDSRLTSDATQLADEADSGVKAGLPRRTFSANFVDTPQALYGDQINFGDFVTVMFEGESIDCRLNAVRITVNKNSETIDAKLRAD